MTVAVHPDNARVIPASRPELMCHGIGAAGHLRALLDAATVVAIGPGLGTGQWAQDLFAAATAADRPLVVDADALTLLARDPARRDRRVITPHPGEAARLLGVDSGAVQANRLAALGKLADRYGGTTVLKGAGTLVSGARGAWLCAAGNPGMAAPGMGDVLTGIIAALLAQGLAPERAAVAAVDAHARAGDVAASGGERGVLASDVIAELRPWLNG